MTPELLSKIYVYTLLAVWLGYGAWISMRTYRRGGRQDRGTRVVFAGGIFLPFVIAFFVERAGIGALEPWLDVPLAWVGGTIMLAGILLWMRSIATLGGLFSINVDIPEDHRLVATGPYAYVRHPAYLGMLITMLGFGVASANWVVAVVFVLVPLAAFLWRISVEEDALVAHFGDAYLAYATRTKRLIPYVY